MRFQRIRDAVHAVHNLMVLLRQALRCVSSSRLAAGSITIISLSGFAFGKRDSSGAPESLDSF